MTPPLIVFDLDGTLIDSALDLIDSLNHTIEIADLEPVTFADVTYLVGQGARVMIKRAFDLRGKTLAEADVGPLLERFVTHYQAHMPGHATAYPGLLNALDRLKDAGFKLAVCTNKLERLALPLMEKLDLTRYFDVITGGDTFEFRKPDARHLLGTIARAGGDAARSIMIGDSINDILAAQNANVSCMAVPFGYSDVAVETLRPDFVLKHYDELTPKLADDLLRARQAA